MSRWRDLRKVSSRSKARFRDVKRGPTQGCIRRARFCTMMFVEIEAGRERTKACSSCMYAGRSLDVDLAVAPDAQSARGSDPALRTLQVLESGTLLRPDPVSRSAKSLDRTTVPPCRALASSQPCVSCRPCVLVSWPYALTCVLRSCS